MFARWLVPVVLFAVLLSQAGEIPSPVAEGTEGKRAFDDLAAYYANHQTVPSYRQAFANMASPDAAKAKIASEYIVALFKQLLADESNGRAPRQQTPFFGGGATCDAREFRRTLADAFGKEAEGEAALDAVLWLIECEKDARNQPAGMDALHRIKAPRCAEIIGKILQQSHCNTTVVTLAIAEAVDRSLKDLTPSVTRLCGHYRASVRDAARAAATRLGVASIPEFKPENAYTPWLDEQLRNIAAMVFTEIPPDAVWTRFTLEPNRGEKPREFSGWLLSENDGKVRLVDSFGVEQQHPKAKLATAPHTLADEVKALLAVRNGGDVHSLSRRGMATGQFEPKFLSVPEALVSAWCYQRGDKASAAALLFPRLDAMTDERWLGWVAHDLLGAVYHQKMLEAFSYERDYAKTLALAQHLAKPEFDEYSYQARAKELAAQLAQRMDDFKTFVLPDEQKWAELKTTLKREEQIKYLADHLRLLNCIQRGQPGNVSYLDGQFAQAQSKGGKVINPYTELQALKLDLPDLPVLAPLIADTNFMPTFSYWRDFHPGRTLHQVNWAIAELLNETAKRDLANLKQYASLDDAGKKKHIETILDWCKANAGKTRDQLPNERSSHAGAGQR